MGTQYRKFVAYGVTSRHTNRNTVTKASRRGVATLTTRWRHISNTATAMREHIFYSSLTRYGKSIQNIIRNLKKDLDVPIALMGDFNINISDGKNELAEFLAREFKIHHHSNALPTTLGNTCIDHVFLRNMNTECMPYVSYLSYHRPLLKKLALM
jgi:endonuclease/exonuclease/phosphatase (EEP) superfamily protein YafD